MICVKTPPEILRSANVQAGAVYLIKDGVHYRKPILQIRRFQPVKIVPLAVQQLRRSFALPPTAPYIRPLPTPPNVFVSVALFFRKVKSVSDIFTLIFCVTVDKEIRRAQPASLSAIFILKEKSAAILLTSEMVSAIIRAESKIAADYAFSGGAL